MRIVEIIIDVGLCSSAMVNGMVVLTIDYRASSRTPFERSSQDGMVSLFAILRN